MANLHLTILLLALSGLFYLTAGTEECTAEFCDLPLVDPDLLLDVREKIAFNPEALITSAQAKICDGNSMFVKVTYDIQNKGNFATSYLKTLEKATPQLSSSSNDSPMC